VVFDVTPVFTEHLAGNRGPDPSDPERRQAPNYGVVATLEGQILKVELTFRKGSAYCCFEWGCHVGLTPLTRRWDDLRRRLVVHGIQPPARIELRRTCVIEEGALFFDPFRPEPTRRGWYAFAPAAAQRYQWTSLEVPSREADSDLGRT